MDTLPSQPSSFAAKESTRASPKGSHISTGLSPLTKPPYPSEESAWRESSRKSLNRRSGSVSCAKKRRGSSSARPCASIFSRFNQERESVHVASRHGFPSRAVEKAEIGPQPGLAPDFKGANEKSRPTQLLNLRVNVSHAQCVSHRPVETDGTGSGKHRLKSVHSFAAGINGKIGKTTLRAQEGVCAQFHEAARHVQAHGDETSGCFLIEHQRVFGLGGGEGNEIAVSASFVEQFLGAARNHRRIDASAEQDRGVRRPQAIACRFLYEIEKLSRHLAGVRR